MENKYKITHLFPVADSDTYQGLKPLQFWNAVCICIPRRIRLFHFLVYLVTYTLYSSSRIDSVVYEFMTGKLFRYSDQNDPCVGLVNNPSWIPWCFVCDLCSQNQCGEEYPEIHPTKVVKVVKSSILWYVIPSQRVAVTCLRPQP